MAAMAEVTIDMARQAKARVRDMAADFGEVTGIGLAMVGGSYAVKVNLRGEKRPGMPPQVDGVPVFYEQTGPARPR
jgi:hypothetical protein